MKLHALWHLRNATCGSSLLSFFVVCCLLLTVGDLERPVGHERGASLYGSYCLVPVTVAVVLRSTVKRHDSLFIHEGETYIGMKRHAILNDISIILRFWTSIGRTPHVPVLSRLQDVLILCSPGRWRKMLSCHGQFRAASHQTMYDEVQIVDGLIWKNDSGFLVWMRLRCLSDVANDLHYHHRKMTVKTLRR